MNDSTQAAVGSGSWQSAVAVGSGHCYCRLLLPTAVILVLIVSGSPAQEKKEAAKEEALLANDRLLPTDPKDKVHPSQRYKLYKFKMVAGTTYTIDMIRHGNFDPYLRLEDSKGKELARDDDSGGNLNARITFRAPATDTYRIFATSLNGAQGDYTLRVWPVGVTLEPGAVRMEGRRQEVEDIVIMPDSMAIMNFSGGGNEAGHGYEEYRFNILNQSATESHRVTLTIPQGNMPIPRTGHFLRSIKRTVEVGPKSSVSLTLFQPDLPLAYNSASAEVSIDGRVKRDGIGVSLARDRGVHNYGRTPASPEILRKILTTEDASVLRGNAFKSVVGKPAVVGGYSRFGSESGDYRGLRYVYSRQDRFFSSATAIPSWNKDWLSYSGYEGMVLAGDKFQAAPPEVQAAIRQYVENGGSLVLIGDASVPKNWGEAKDLGNGLTAYYPGFGQCLVTAEKDINKWEPQQWGPITEMWAQSAQPWKQVLSPTDANHRFPIVENLRIPVRGMFIVMLIFAFLIGPLNIRILTRKKRRIWLLWTVPSISLLACLALAGYMFFSEGWTGQVRSEGLTILDENAQRANSIGWLGIYSPITPGDGLHVSYDTELTPHLRQDPTYYRRSGTPRTIDWTDDQHLDSGWVTARIPAHFLVRTGQKRLERVLVQKEADGSLTMVNALEVKIGKFWLTDAEGKIYTAADVAGGAKAVLKRSDDKAKGKPDALRQAYAKDWLGLVDTLTTRPEDFLRPNCYIALVENSPFLEEGLRNAGVRKGRGVVYGIRKLP